MSKTKSESRHQTLEGQVMYIGPNLISPFPLAHKSVYTDGIPDVVKKAVQTDENLAGCFVSLFEAAKALRELEGYPGEHSGKYIMLYKNVKEKYRKES